MELGSKVQKSLWYQLEAVEQSLKKFFEVLKVFKDLYSCLSRLKVTGYTTIYQAVIFFFFFEHWLMIGTVITVIL